MREFDFLIVGSLDLEFDPDGNPWVAMMYQASVAKLDRASGKVTLYPLPKEFDNPRVQIGMIDPRNSHRDGKVWFSEGGTRTFYRLDLASGKFPASPRPSARRVNPNPGTVRASAWAMAANAARDCSSFMSWGPAVNS
jgi:streptogramin lyase